MKKGLIGLLLILVIIGCSGCAALWFGAGAGAGAAGYHIYDKTHRDCPHCKKSISNDATICPYCQGEVEPIKE